MLVGSQTMVDQVFRSIASERKQIPTWDVESILTRAVYRALSSNGQLSQALDHQPANVDKCLTTNDAQLQLKLVAEKLCKRVERRYEKKLLQQRERDRTEIARKLSEIRNEYAEQVDVKRRDLERERLRLEESYVEKERNLRHKLEMQLAEKESALEITRKSLENRLAELNMNKEHLDRIKAEFHVKFASDVEKLNEEWERLSAKREELRVVFKEEFEEDQHQMKEKLIELENENIVLKKRLGENGTDLFEMRSKLSKVATLEDDLQFANEKLRREVEENHRLSRSRYEADRLKEENVYLKEEIERLTAAARQQNPSIPAQSSLKSPEDLQQSKIKELKTIIRLMNDKITSLTSERDYLREMLRDAKRQIFGKVVGIKQTGLERTAGNLRFRRFLRDTDSSEDTSLSSSAVSECASDLRTIKERFATLENMAKTLDTTIEHVAAARSMTHDPFVSSPEPSVVSESENYDDFCRSLKRSGNLYSSPVKNVTKEMAGLRLNPEIPNVEQAPELEEKRMRDEVTPRAATPARRDFVREIVHEPILAKRNSQEVTLVPAHNLSEAPNEPDQATLFAEKLRARTEASQKLNFSQEFEESSLPIARKNIDSGEGTTALDSYMALFTTKSAAGTQNDNKNLKPANLLSSNDIPLEVEDVQVDKPGASEDEIDCCSHNKFMEHSCSIHCGSPLHLFSLSDLLQQQISYSVDVANSHQQRLPMSYSPQGKMRQMRRLRFCVVALAVVLVTYWLIFGDEDSVARSPTLGIPPEWMEMCEFLERKWQGSEGQIADTGFRLRGLAIAFRHGERSPLRTTDDREGCLPFREEDRKDFQQYRSLVSSDDFQFFLRHDRMFENFSSVPSHSECSPGQMTAEGALQHVKLGNYIRKKYSSSSIFAPESRLNVFVTSSPFNRTYQSAIAFTSSFLYPLRVTIPQVFIQASNFTFMCTNRNCQCDPAKQWRLQYEQEHAQYFRERSPEHLRVVAAALKSISNFNKTIDPFQMIDVALGSYVCRRRPLPCFSRGNCLDYGFLSELVKETTIRGKVMYDERSRYIAQKLQLVESYGVLYHIVETIEKLRGFAHTNIIQVFSGHDVMLAPLLRVMGVPFVDPPHYASHIVIEFYEAIGSYSTKDSVHLRFIYNGVDITNSITFCENYTQKPGLCPAQQLEEFVQKRIFLLLGVSSLRDICDTAAQ